jgi:hypothetical protein
MLDWNQYREPLLRRVRICGQHVSPFATLAAALWRRRFGIERCAHIFVIAHKNVIRNSRDSRTRVFGRAGSNPAIKQIAPQLSSEITTKSSHFCTRVLESPTLEWLEDDSLHRMA